MKIKTQKIGLSVILSATFLLSACSSTQQLYLSQDKSPLEENLPNITLQQLLTKPVENAYCKENSSVEMQHGGGILLYNAKNYKEAKNCFVMAAPEIPRATCFLAEIAKSEKQTSPKPIDYYIYGATQKDWCAEWALYFAYLRGEGLPKDEALAYRWLERSAMHGNSEAQRRLGTYYIDNNNLPLAYVWYSFADEYDSSNNFRDYIKKQMTEKQIKEGEKLLTEIRPSVTPLKELHDEGRRENTGRYLVTITMNYPEVLKGKSSAEQVEWVSELVRKGERIPAMTKNSQFIALIVLTGKAQLKNPGIDLSSNTKLIETLTTYKNNNSKDFVADLVKAGTKVLSEKD